MIKFSVLINNYNYARFLPETLASVAAQTHAPHEIIVVDDGSRDDSLAVLESLRATVPGLRVHAQPNGGQLSAMRAGIRLATGDWCAFLDSDDLWTPDHLARAAAAISRDPKIGFYYCDHRETDGPAIYHTKWPAGSVGPCAALVACTATRIGTITSATILRSDFARKAVSIDPALDEDWRVRADDCLVFGAALAGAIIHYSPDATVRYRIHGANSYANSADPLAEYQYLFRRTRLFAAYRERFGIAREDLLDCLGREIKFADNARHPAIRRRYRRAIRKSDAPWSRRWDKWFRVLRG